MRWYTYMYVRTCTMNCGTHTCMSGHVLWTVVHIHVCQDMYYELWYTYMYVRTCTMNCGTHTCMSGHVLWTVVHIHVCQDMHYELWYTYMYVRTCTMNCGTHTCMSGHVLWTVVHIHVCQDMHYELWYTYMYIRTCTMNCGTHTCMSGHALWTVVHIHVCQDMHYELRYTYMYVRTCIMNCGTHTCMSGHALWTVVWTLVTGLITNHVRCYPCTSSLLFPGAGWITNHVRCHLCTSLLFPGAGWITNHVRCYLCTSLLFPRDRINHQSCQMLSLYFSPLSVFLMSQLCIVLWWHMARVLHACRIISKTLEKPEPSFHNVTRHVHQVAVDVQQCNIVPQCMYEICWLSWHVAVNSATVMYRHAFIINTLHNIWIYESVYWHSGESLLKYECC